MNPTIIQIDPVDNVAIVANDEGLPSGTVVAGGITLREFVPQGHKVALSFIQKNSPIIRFGEVIGWALEDRLEGSWLNERNIRMPESPGLDDLVWGGRERETRLHRRSGSRAHCEETVDSDARQRQATSTLPE